MAFRKRVFGGKPRKGVFKKRRMSKFMPRKQRRTTDAFSATNGLRMRQVAFGGKKTPRKQWKSDLWTSTSSKDKFRSANTARALVVTDTSDTRSQTTNVNMIGSNFYTSAGGAQSPINAGTTFEQDLTIRGGNCTFTMYNDPANNSDSILVELFVLMTNGRGIIPVASVVDRAWDPTMVANNDNQFKVLKRWKFIVSKGETVSVEHRIRLRKWDIIKQTSQNEFIPVWMVKATKFGLIGVAQQLNCWASHSLSFTADVVN